MISAHYPTRHMAGWELDPAVVMAARLYMGMDEVEATGRLTCHTGDALDPGATVEGGFAGIIVDLFADGRVLPQLTTVGPNRIKSVSKCGGFNSNRPGSNRPRVTHSGRLTASFPSLVRRI